MKTCYVFLFAFLCSLSIFSQTPSLYSNNELILFMSPDSDSDDLALLLLNLDMHLIEGPTPNLNAYLLGLNQNPPVSNPFGPITGKKLTANSNSKVTGVGFNYLLEARAFTNSGSITDHCHEILDPITQPNGGNDIVAAIFDTGISGEIRNNNSEYFDLMNVGYNALEPNFPPVDDNNHGTHISSIMMNNLENANGAVQFKAYKTHDFEGYSSTVSYTHLTLPTILLV